VSEQAASTELQVVQAAYDALQETHLALDAQLQEARRQLAEAQQIQPAYDALHSAHLALDAQLQDVRRQLAEAQQIQPAYDALQQAHLALDAQLQDVRRQLAVAQQIQPAYDALQKAHLALDAQLQETRRQLAEAWHIQPAYDALHSAHLALDAQLQEIRRQFADSGQELKQKAEADAARLEIERAQLVKNNRILREQAENESNLRREAVAETERMKLEVAKTISNNVVLKRQADRVITQLERIQNAEPANQDGRITAASGPYTPQATLPQAESDSPDIIAQPNVLIFCFPKSGSTFLELASAQALQLRHVLSPFDADVNGLRFEDIMVHGGGFVTKNHIPATPQNIAILRYFGIRPIVLVRNLFDAILSLAEDAQFTTINDRQFAFGYVRPDFANLTLDARLELISETYLGWYLSFFASWFRAAETGLIDCLFLTYEKLVESPDQQLRLIADWVGTPLSEKLATETCAAVGRGAHTRFNKGVVGRGQDAFPEATKNRIRAIARRFSDVDFSRIGL
jgi:hypothetical protein